MALSLGVHGLGNNTFTTSTTSPARSTQATGSTFVVPIQTNRAGDPLTIVSVIDTFSNTYTARTADNPGYGGDINAAAWACENGSGGANHTVTVTFSDQCTNNVDLIELLGVDTSGSAADGVAHTSGGGTAGTTLPGPGLTTTNANDIIVSWLATYGFNTGTVTITSDTGSGWALVDTVLVGTTSRHCASSYNIVSSIGTYNDTYTTNNTDGYSALTLAFKAASGGGGVTVALTGQRATLTPGSLAPSTARALTGQSVACAAGSLVPGTALALSGTRATFATGSLVPAMSIPLLGTQVSFAAGNVTVSGSGNVTVALTGQAATFSPGALTPNTSVAFVGIASSFAAGTMTPASSVAVTGQSALFATGIVVPTSSIILTGSAASFATGNLLTSSSLTLTGISAVFSAGSPSPATSVALQGTQSSFTPGNVSTTGDVTVALTGARATFNAGIVTASGGQLSQLPLAGWPNNFGTFLVKQ